MSLFQMYGGIEPRRVQDIVFPMFWSPGIVVEYACKTIRDLFIVTDRRILNVDKQGLTGAKKNYDSIAFNKIGRFSVEFGGKLAGIVTVRIWASGAGDKLEVVFDKTANGEGIQNSPSVPGSCRLKIPISISPPHVPTDASTCRCCNRRRLSPPPAGPTTPGIV